MNYITYIGLNVVDLRIACPPISVTMAELRQTKLQSLLHHTPSLATEFPNQYRILPAGMRGNLLRGAMTGSAMRRRTAKARVADRNEVKMAACERQGLN